MVLIFILCFSFVIIRFVVSYGDTRELFVIRVKTAVYMESMESRLSTYRLSPPRQPDSLLRASPHAFSDWGSPVSSPPSRAPSSPRYASPERVARSGPNFMSRELRRVLKKSTLSTDWVLGLRAELPILAYPEKRLNRISSLHACPPPGLTRSLIIK
ncbi:hypothetical protein B0T26DRAFT_60312 [Lasiosphaeria miniovina]|uniref:Uncharacterized protein n=1 Tax=Lasiosphaeria miniovina TaxID=1954250 RepID=A0AA40EDC7_9PEZI|nr:uncharacterized protein B0T26DRAFT_60312 [Lasiosphaeria miniovina]KAK0734212.1 hypothetical protein B0T26DRAFT_60312 [Lasiosphaeria miniovina]